MTVRYLAITIALSIAASCSTQSADVSRLAGTDDSLHAAGQAITVTAGNIGEIAAQAGDAYLVGPGDVLQIRAIDAPELTTPAGYEVEGDGAIEVPFLGRIPVADRETSAIRAEIQRRLQDYFPDPQVDLRVIEYNARQISVVGEVHRPNRQTLTARPLSVIDAINAAGGFAYNATRRDVTIQRNGRDIPVDMKGFLEEGRPLPILRDGDVVHVSRLRLGQRAPAPQGVLVQMPDRPERRIDQGARRLSIAQIAARKGAADLPVQVIRQGETGRLAYRLAPGKVSDPAVGGRFTLLDGDRVVLGPAGN